MKQQNPIFYRATQFLSLLLGARIFLLVFFTFTLYVSTFFLFSREESLHQFVFDYKVHGIILCSVLSIAAGGIINHFYDREKDRIQKPFRTRLQSFLKLKYFLYCYLALNTFSLGIAYFLSPRIFIFFLVYQFLIWFYSHKISRVAVLNNLTYVTLSLYPFFGMLVYYQHFSWRLFFMASFLFFVLLSIDLIKDLLTVRPDKIFNYNTIPIFFGFKTSIIIILVLLTLGSFSAGLVITQSSHFGVLSWYYALSTLLMILAMYPLIFFKLKNMVVLMNFLKTWIFVGVIFMLMNGILSRF